ncbi:putative ribonuclease H-like domain-containing protein [Tanacetum coccineum]
MLTVKVKKFIQRTGRNMAFKEKQPVSLDMSKIECFNCHRKGHFARECRSARNQGRRPYGDNGRSNAPSSDSSSHALVAQDGLGKYDWSNDFEIEPNYDTEREKHNKAKLEIRGYEIALESLEARILGHEKNELAWGEIKERDELKLKIEKWEGSSKNLTKILNSQMSAHDKNGLGFGTQIDELSNKSETDSENCMTVFEVRSSDEESTLGNSRFTKATEYHAVQPLITGNPLTPRADISFAGLDEYAIRNKIIESKTLETTKTLGNTNDKNAEKPKSVNEKVVSKTGFNRDEVIIEDWTSDDEEDMCHVNTVSSVKPNMTQAVRNCDFYDQKSPEPRVKNVVNTGKREVKLVWDYSKRVIGLKIAQSNSVIRPNHPRLDIIRPKASNSPINRPKDLKSDVKTFGIKNITTAGLRAVFSKGKVENVLEKANCVWRPKGNLEILLQDHTVVDSGYSSHMTGKKAYLSDYEDLNGGFVAFGNELKFNLFSVLQMCDKKNSILFTESECLILSSSFKLLDESQVVLRAPRKDGVYNVDLKNIVPSGGLTCSYANATTDRSKLWHKRLGHVNFKNINKLVKGYLVRGLPSKVFVNNHTWVACKKGKQHKASCKAKLDRVIRKPLELLHIDLFGPVSIERINKKRCDNGIEFKNYVMNELCAKKGIKGEFSVARTPQQNGVAEKEK